VRDAGMTQPTRQALTAFGGMAIGLALFVIIERLVVPRYDFATPADSAIPFVPLTWPIYMLFFPFVIAMSALARERDFDSFRCAATIAFLLSFVCFAWFPEEIPRPDQATIDNAFLRQRLARLWMMDLASNGCPSLHVSITCLACRMVWPTPHRWHVAATGVLICLSTLTLKQHTLADVAGGLSMALLCAGLTARLKRQEVFHGAT
jgi:membrane-associated phospholipid phosphatase